ncbi:hypothetical protein D3C75_1383920 [compost metagenome]
MARAQEAGLASVQLQGPLSGAGKAERRPGDQVAAHQSRQGEVDLAALHARDRLIGAQGVEDLGAG